MSPSVRSRRGRVGFQSRAFNIDLDTDAADDESSTTAAAAATVAARLAAAIFACLAPAPICDASEPRLLLDASAASAEPFPLLAKLTFASMNTLECRTDGKKSVFSRRKTRGNTDRNEELGSRRRTLPARAACLWKLLRNSATLLLPPALSGAAAVPARGDGVRVPDEDDDNSNL